MYTKAVTKVEKKQQRGQWIVIEFLFLLFGVINGTLKEIYRHLLMASACGHYMESG